MRILLDECVPRGLKRHLPGHEVQTVPEAGWSGVKNGLLLARAKGRFDVLLSTDPRRGISAKSPRKGHRNSRPVREVE